VWKLCYGAIAILFSKICELRSGYYLLSLCVFNVEALIFGRGEANYKIKNGKCPSTYH
jgi:hypothetical protein